MNRPRLLPIFVAISLFGALGCEDSTSPDVATGTETNWLQSCERDSDCEGWSCECGVCTSACDSDDQCTMEGAYCSPSDGNDVTALCGESETATKRLCLLSPGDDASDDDASGDDASGDDDASDDDSSDDDSSGDDDVGDDDTPSGSGGASSGGEGGASADDDDLIEPAQGGASTGNGGAGSPGPVIPGPDGGAGGVTGAGGMSSAGGAGGAGGASSNPIDYCADLDRSELGDCCYDDSDCAEGELCYSANCDSPAVFAGRCAAPVEGQCYGERDCAEGELCEGGYLAQCGSLGPDALGTCAICEYDSCHPERCDEVGEPCCDPFPGDGPNYCNADLECLAEGCQPRAETTTPEAQARMACESTGGVWDYETCGDYACGLPPDCNAVIPGCNCGFSANVGTFGCEPDASCTTASQPFTCGEETCVSVGTQYCEEFTGGPGITTYRCVDIPDECLDVAGCECLLGEGMPVAAPATCRIGGSGEWIYVPPPAP